MPAIKLMNDELELLGFMLLATEDPLSSNMQYDCIMTGPPQNPALIETSLCKMIQERKNIEFALKVSNGFEQFSVELTDGWNLTFNREGEDAGSLIADNIDGTTLNGKWAGTILFK